MELDFSALKDAIEQLKNAHRYSVSDLAKDKGLFEQFRNSTNQCFEFTFELSWKSLQRKLETIHPNPQSIDSMDFKDLFREGAVRGYIQSPEAWFEFRRLRNLSSHAYDKSKAEQVYNKALDLVTEAQFLVTALSQSK